MVWLSHLSWSSNYQNFSGLHFTFTSFMFNRYLCTHLRRLTQFLSNCRWLFSYVSVKNLHLAKGNCFCFHAALWNRSALLVLIVNIAVLFSFINNPTSRSQGCFCSFLAGVIGFSTSWSLKLHIDYLSLYFTISLLNMRRVRHGAASSLVLLTFRILIFFIESN